MQKGAVEGGPVLDLAAAEFGGTWAPDDTIYYCPSYDGGVWRISSGGGVPERVTEPNREDNELGHWYPQVLPDGKSLLYNAYRSPIDKARVVVLSLETGERRVLLEGAFHARYASSGHLVYGGKDAIMAVPFNLSRLEVTGLPVPVLEDVYVKPPNGNTAFSFSENGTLVYARDEVVDPPRRLVWVDQEGNATPLGDKLRSYHAPQLSPDGRRLAVTIFERGVGDVWIEDMELGTQTRISLGETDDSRAVWAPDV